MSTSTHEYQVGAGAVSFTSVIVLVLFFAVTLVPAIKILRRMGFSGWWVVLQFIPILNIVQLWYLAVADWPND